MAADNRDNVKKREKNPNSLANLRPNPGGRPKQPKEFKELVKAHTVDALKTVIEIMQSPDAKPSDRLKASELIIDRAYGKATQPIAGDAEFDAIKMDYHDPAAVEARINELIAKRSAGA